MTDLQTDLSRFWELDEGPIITHFSESERLCEEHFRDRVRRTKEGRYIVALPFNEKLPCNEQARLSSSLIPTRQAI